MRAEFPFAALVGQAALLDALVWLAVEPTIGGVLVTGTRGTAKSTAVRALAASLPHIEIVPDDPFNTAPACAGDAATSVPTPFVELPVGASEDRVIGTLDVRTLLVEGERRFEPGLLARANRGVLYVDEVNLLPDHLVDVVLDAAASGTNRVERDGASVVHSARIMLVGSMNPEEGELRPQLLDRFGLCVSIPNDEDLDRRVEIIERRMRFDRDPAGFEAEYARQTRERREGIVRARALLPHVGVDRDCLRLASWLALEARVEGMRADLTIVRTARAIAACAGRAAVVPADIEAAATPALAHRRREAPRGAPPRPPSAAPRNGASSDRADAPASSNGADADAEKTFGIGAAVDTTFARFDAPRSLVPPAVRRRFVARGSSSVVLPAGVARVVRRATPRVAAFATLQAAATVRAPLVPAGPLAIDRGHLRYIERRGRERELVILAVDASGSMAAASRMEAAKGVVCGLLEDAYRRRDAVALIAFRGAEAELLVPPTRSAVLAYRRLQSLATGGRTPVAAALRRVRELSQTYARREPGTRAALIVISDARANAPHDGAFEVALAEAALLRPMLARALCVDTETGRIRLRYAQRLATALGAAYRHLDECSERALGATVKEWMATA
ncbi:MAG: ATP-binding protein [Candidatus Velthaea sp.]